MNVSYIDVPHTATYTRAGSIKFCKKALCILKQELALSEEDRNHDRDEEVAKRRVALSNIYNDLPVYGSVAYWHAVEKPDTPLEVLVRCERVAVAHGDDEGRNRLFEVIFRRIHISNEIWANSVLKTASLLEDERNALVSDLYADLCECVIRALMDTTRMFWEENFQHCLMYERKHVYQTFMAHEGRWSNQHTKRPKRIPRRLLGSLDRPKQGRDGEVYESNVEDELAQKALFAVEHADIPQQVLYLPDKLKSVVWLIFWEGRTEKDTARALGITDRTVRNRLHAALTILRHTLEFEREGIHG